MNIICTLLKNYTVGWLVGVYRPFSQKYGYIRDESKTIQRQRQHTDQRAKSMLNESEINRKQDTSPFLPYCGPFAKEQGSCFTISTNFKVSSTFQVSCHFASRCDWFQYV